MRRMITKRSFQSLCAIVMMFCSVSLFADTEPNNSIAEANPLSFNTEQSGSLAVEVGDNNDYYSLELLENGTVHIEGNYADGLTGYIYLYNSAGGQLGFSSAGSGDKSLTIGCMAAGTVYVRINRSSGSGDYTFTASYTTPEFSTDLEPNDNGGNANSIDLIQDTYLEGELITGQLGYQNASDFDTEDWYYIVSPHDGDVSLTFEFSEGLFGYIYLYEKDGTQITFSYLTGNENTAVATCMAEDTLVARISRTSGCGSYSGSFTTSDLTYANDVEPNGTGSAVESIEMIEGTLEEGETFTGHLGYLDADTGYDRNDWYKIVTTDDGSVTLNVEYTENLIGYIYLYEKDGTQIGFSYLTGEAGSYTAICQSADTLVARINQASGCGSYTASISVDPPEHENDVEPNGGGSAVLSIDMIQDTWEFGDVFTGHLGHSDADIGVDNNDWYYLINPSDGDVTLSVDYSESLTGYIYLYEKDGTQIGFSYLTGEAGTYTASCRAADTLVARINRAAGCGSYEASFSVSNMLYANDAESNNSIETAIPYDPENLNEGHIGYLDADTGYDNDDYYAVFVEAPFSFEMNIVKSNNFSGYLYLYSPSGTQLGFIYHAGQIQATYTDELDETGTYYVRVNRSAGCGSYSLYGPNLSPSIESDPISCSDGIDNNGDGLIDCEDPQCFILSNNVGCETCFGDGLSFADEVIEYVNNCDNNTATDASQAIGMPDYSGDLEHVSLGDGYVTLGFTNNTLINSGNDDPDLFVFEVGPLVESSAIELRPLNTATEDILIANNILDSDNDGFYEFGEIGGSTASVDIDAFLDGLETNSVQFDAIKIVDYQIGCSTATPGPDIDAVCALSSIPCVIGGPCDDGDDQTENDVFDSNCNCAGTPIVYDCPDLMANVGDSCDDNDPNTINDSISDACDCIGESIFDCPDLQANNGDDCESVGGNPGTIVNCECIEDAILGCMDLLACNYDSNATEDDGSCIVPTPECTACNSTNDGLILIDGDGDGVCDSEDDCPDLADLSNGDPCTNDDGAEGTVSNCECVVPETAFATLLELECGGMVIQVSGAFEGETDGGSATSDTRTIYAFAPDGGNGVPTYAGASWPYVIIDGDLAIDEDITAVLSLNDDGVLLVNGWPAYQFANDQSPDDATGTFGPWNYFLADGELSQDACPPVFDCPDLSANIGDSCDDGDDNTENDMVNDNCECVGTPVFDCPDLDANIGDACDDGDDNTENDTVNDNCECVGTPVFDCPELDANIGDACDDGDDMTENDMVNDACECVGTPILIFDCPELEANIGDACDDGDDNTENDMVNDNCECVGTPIFDCPELEANIGDMCDDGNDNTENDMVNDNCECVGTPIFDCPELEANIGDACDDGDDMTENDMVNDACECAGTPVEVFDCPDLMANIGDPCDDGDDMTGNDMINADCECVGEPIVPSDCEDWVMYLNDNDGGETDLYGVQLVGGNAELTFLTTIGYQAHIAYNPADNMVYVVSNVDASYVKVNPHVSPVEVSEVMYLSEDVPSVTTAVFSPDGALLIGSATQDMIYSVDVMTNNVTVYDAYAPVNGGDIAFDNEGMLYLATRQGNGLYEVYPDGVWDDILIGSLSDLVTGLALTEDGRLLTSHNGNANLEVRNTDGSNPGDTYALMLDGEAFDHNNGDMASGCNTFSDENEGDCENFDTFYSHYGSGTGVSGADIYQVMYSGNEAVLTFLTNVPFGAHIAYNAEDDILYLVNPNGSFVRAYDPTLGVFIGDLPIIGGINSLYAVVYNPFDGLLYVGDDNDNEIYTIDLGTGQATYFADAPVSGGDLAIQDGKLYLANRNQGKLYEIVGGAAVFAADIPAANGMAQANNSTGLVLAHPGTASFIEVDAADGSEVAVYTATVGGEALTLSDGDMAAGCGDDEPVIVPEGECYAVATEEYVEGTQLDNSPLLAERADPNNALGAPEGIDALVFTTLGYGGSITVSFDGSVPNGEGDDIEVVETSYNNPGCASYPEYATVEVSMDGVNWATAGTVCKGDPYVDISDAGDYEYVMYVRVTNDNDLSTSSDGFDVDGIVALHNCEEDGDGGEGVEDLLSVDSQNQLTSFPNPTNGPSQVVFVTAETGRTLVEVYDMNGRMVEALFNQEAEAGVEYRLDFNGNNLPNGVYIYRMTTENEVVIDKFIMSR